MIGSTGVDLHSKLPVVQKNKKIKKEGEKKFSRRYRPPARLRLAPKTRDDAISASRGWSQEAGKSVY